MKRCLVVLAILESIFFSIRLRFFIVYCIFIIMSLTHALSFIAGNSCAVHLSLRFSAVVKHGFLPPLLTNVVLTPIVKDKSGKLTEKDNYRPIAVATARSNILERIVLNRRCVQLNTSHHQFGFKENHSTHMTIYALKEVMDYYLRNSSPVCICYLDASKAFERVNHFVLFDKLLDRGMDPHLVSLVCFWYRLLTISCSLGKIHVSRF